MNDLLIQFQELYEKQDLLSRFTDYSLFSYLSFSEVHTLAAIARLGEPNATQIANHLRMTRGAISKILKKLADKDLIEIFQKPTNQKEKFYRLSGKGVSTERRHKEAHQKWEKRDMQFLQSIPVEEQKVVSSFLIRFNQYLEDIIKEESK